jgi:DNA invertase Pin-like site-specific DNA recombinase
MRAVGVVRVSQVSGREGESFHSPDVQRAAIHTLAGREGWEVLAVHEELDVSGNALLEDRPGLSQAVTAVQTGAARVIAAAFTERLWWNAEVRAQVLRLVESHGGEVWSADEGRLSNASAAEEFTGTTRTAADRFSRRQNAEKSRAAVLRAVERGVVPWPNIPPGYTRGEDGLLVPNDDADTIRAAFALRDDGAPIASVRELLARGGVHRSYHGTQKILGSRLYLGEIHFGGVPANLTAHDPIVDRAMFDRVQRVHVPRGRRAKSERLLARLGVLRCRTCGSRMVVGTSHNSTYWLYRCPPVGDCPQRVTISAPLVEAVVVAAVRRRLAHTEGRASAERNVHDAQVALERAQSDLDAAIRAFAGLEDEDAARTRLAELRDARDEARERVAHLGSPRLVMTVNLSRDWDLLTLEERRVAIRLTVAAVRVAPGRGAGRVKVDLLEPLGDEAAGD